MQLAGVRAKASGLLQGDAARCCELDPGPVRGARPLRGTRLPMNPLPQHTAQGENHDWHWGVH
eukprot:scaffold115712_cov63-Phaeocystis_antarctica.AAC.1